MLSRHTESTAQLGLREFRVFSCARNLAPQLNRTKLLAAFHGRHLTFLMTKSKGRGRNESTMTTTNIPPISRAQPQLTLLQRIYALSDSSPMDTYGPLASVLRKLSSDDHATEKAHTVAGLLKKLSVADQAMVIAAIESLFPAGGVSAHNT